MILQSSRGHDFGKDIGVRTGFYQAETLDDAERKIWEKYGSDASCKLKVWEATDSISESFVTYYK